MATNSLSRTFNGQKIFQDILVEYPQNVIRRVRSEGFHNAWKEITQMPKEGNYNPNYKDCIAYIEAVQEQGMDDVDCDVLPVERGLVEWRDGLSPGQQWQTMLNFCLVYKELAGLTKRPKRSGLLPALFNEGYITHETVPSADAASLLIIGNELIGEMDDTRQCQETTTEIPS